MSQLAIVKQMFEEKGIDMLGEHLAPVVKKMDKLVHESTDQLASVTAHMDDTRASKETRMEDLVSETSIFRNTDVTVRLVAMMESDVESLIPISFKLNKSDKNYMKTMVVCNRKALDNLVAMFYKVIDIKPPGKCLEDAAEEDSRSVSSASTINTKSIYINISGIDPRQVEMVRDYYREHIQNWVANNCGPDDDKEERKKVQSKWRAFLAKSQATGCYTNIIPNNSTRTGLAENKERMIEREFHKFLFWICKGTKTEDQICEFSKYVFKGHHVEDEVVMESEFKNSMRETLDSASSLEEEIGNATIESTMALIDEQRTQHAESKRKAEEEVEEQPPKRMKKVAEKAGGGYVPA